MIGFETEEPVVTDRHADMVRRAKLLARQRFPEVRQHAACLHQAWALMAVAHTEGIRLTLQAGSAQWVRTYRDCDAQMFGYVADEIDPVRAVVLDLLPEMHVWVADIARQEIIDPTAGCFPTQCKELIGEDWEIEKPPEFLWCHVSQLPQAAYYRPSMTATMLAGHFLTRMRDEGRLNPPWRV